MVRQVADEPHRVAQEDGPPAGQLPAAGPRVERGEEQVLGKNVGTGQRVQERTLAGIGVADQGNGHLRPPRGDLALAAMLDGAELLPQIADPLLGQAAIDLQLLLAGAAQTHAALRLAREVRPHPLQARHLVFQLGQLDRQAGLVRLGAAGEDVEDQLRAVEDLQAGGFLKIAGLAGAEIVIEKDHVGHFGVGQGGQLLHLSLAQVGCRIGRLAMLSELAHDARAGGFRKTLQFFQRHQFRTAGPRETRPPGPPTRWPRSPCG